MEGASCEEEEGAGGGGEEEEGAGGGGEEEEGTGGILSLGPARWGSSY